jgi:hypothetical protein
LQIRVGADAVTPDPRNGGPRSGIVQRLDSTKRLSLVQIASAIDGVVAVHSRIAYDIDDTSDSAVHDRAT